LPEQSASLVVRVISRHPGSTKRSPCPREYEVPYTSVCPGSLFSMEAGTVEEEGEEEDGRGWCNQSTRPSTKPMHVRARRLGSTSSQAHVCFQHRCLLWKWVWRARRNETGDWVGSCPAVPMNSTHGGVVVAEQVVEARPDILLNMHMFSHGRGRCGEGVGGDV